MSHRIIIDAAAPETGGVSVNVQFSPPHDMTEKEVGERVEKLLKQVKKMQDAPPHEHVG